MLPPIALGLWQNFGGVDAYETGRAVVRRAFDRGVTHFDLANNYGPPPGSAEEGFGRMLADDLRPYRDELVIATKAGHAMWPGPYGDWGSRKYLVASLDQSLRRMGIDYVDIFYHHRPDPDTPLEETMAALAHVVRQGKALHVGLSKYPPERAREAAALLRQMGTPCLIHQFRYSMLERAPEDGWLDTAAAEGMGIAAFSPLAQGLLTDKYLDGVPGDARMARGGSLPPDRLTAALRDSLRRLAAIAHGGGRSLAQLALVWLLRDPRVTTLLVGARAVAQIDDTLAALHKPTLTAEDERAIAAVLGAP
ncbi:MAG: aldo/keto reductase [Alphaproteobacteria bacterium]|nr:aldo/keto reductase [Alphaproteobacteria bacterium]